MTVATLETGSKAVKSGEADTWVTGEETETVSGVPDEERETNRWGGQASRLTLIFLESLPTLKVAAIIVYLTVLVWSRYSLYLHPNSGVCYGFVHTQMDSLHLRHIVCDVTEMGSDRQQPC